MKKILAIAFLAASSLSMTVGCSDTPKPSVAGSTSVSPTATVKTATTTSAAAK